MPRRGPYHHGDLKSALIDAARALIHESGLGNFSFAEAARRAGVSAAAPYRHFKDKDELLREVARRGFIEFADLLVAAWNKGQPSPLSALDAVGRAYLAFARERSDFFVVMFDASVLEDASPELRDASDRAFDVIVRACAALAETAPPAARPPATMMAYHIWSLSHGVAALFGDAGRRNAPLSAEEMLESGVAIYLRGLGLLAH